MGKTDRVPAHVAIIMDGNGRWAQQRNHSRVFGHVRGASRVKAVVKEASQLGIQALTFFAFSTENWSRPSEELRVLWKLLKTYLLREVEELHQENIQFKVIGEIERLRPDIQEIISSLEKKLSGNTGLCLNFAVSYGGRREMVRAAKMLAQDCLDGKLELSTVTEELFEKYLWTSELGELSDVDLVIRTSGEQRISNFLIWQSAYAEYLFTDVLWPDFSPSHLREAVDCFQQRERRFGQVLTPGMTRKVVSDSQAMSVKEETGRKIAVNQRD